MVLEWDGWGWIDVDRKIRFRTCNEDNDHRIASYINGNIINNELVWTKYKTKYRQKSVYYLSFLGYCNRETLIAWHEKEVDNGT